MPGGDRLVGEINRPPDLACACPAVRRHPCHPLRYAAACSGGSDDGMSEAVNSVEQALVEDGLAEAYALFKARFIQLGGNSLFRIGYGPHPGLVTESVVSSRSPMSAERS